MRESTPGVVCLLIGILSLGCSPAASPGRSGSAANRAATTFLYARGEDANTLDPIHTDIGETVKVLVNLYDTLVTYDDETTELVPALATAWRTSDDGRVWTFTLRPGVTFHDGTPFDSAAVKFSFERLIQPDHPHVYEPAVPYRPSFRMIEKIETPGELEVVVHLREPNAILLQNLAMFPASIVSPAAVEKWKKEFGEHPAGTGPFQLAAWKRDEQLVLQANADHWRGPPGVERIIFLPVHDQATRVQQIQRGEVHLADDIPAAELDALSTHADLVIREQPLAMNVAYLTLNTEKPPLDRVDVRRAIAVAIDKQRFVTLQYQNHAAPAKTVVPPVMKGHHAELVDHPFAPEQARKLLEEAAREGGFELPLELSLNVMGQSRPYLPEPTVAAAFIKDSLAAIGIRVTIQQQDVNQHFPYLMAGRHQLGLSGWTSDNNDPDNFLYSLLDSDNIGEHGNNLSRYRNARVHELLTGAQTESDAAQRITMYREAQEIILADVPVVPLAHAHSRVVMRKVVNGFTPHPTGLVRLRRVTIGGSQP